MRTGEVEQVDPPDMDSLESGKIWVEMPSLGFGGGAVDGVFWGVGGNANTLMLPSSRMLISPRLSLVLMKEL